MGNTQSTLEKKLPNKITNLSTKSKRKLNKFQRFRSVNNVRSGKTSVNNDLVIIEGCVESNKKLKILIDSGSQADLISKDIAMELGKDIRSSHMKLASAQGANMCVK